MTLSNPGRFWVWITAALVMTYLVLRAAGMAFTWDESFSWLQFVRGPDWWPEVNTNMAANNHLLNTWLMRLSEQVFGTSAFALRLPNLLLAVVYVLTAAAFARRQQKASAQWAVFVVLVVHPYLLDFFSIARGYGIAHSFMLAGFWCLWRWCMTDRWWHLLSGMLLLSVACFANLTQLHVLLAATGAVVLRIILIALQSRNWRAGSLGLLTALLPTAATLLALIPYSLQLKQAGALFFGAENGWFRGTWRPLIDRMLYGISFPPFLKDVAAAMLVLCAAAGIVLAALWLLRARRQPLSGERWFTTLLALVVAGAMLGPLVQHKFLGTLLLTERTALLYLPLLVLLGVQLFRQLPAWNARWLALPVVPVLLLFVYTANLRSLRDWPDEQDINTVVCDINRMAGKNSPLIVAANSQLVPDLEFARATAALNPTIAVAEVQFPARYEWLYVYAAEARLFPEHTRVCSYPASKTVLLKRRKPFQVIHIPLIATDFETPGNDPVKAIADAPSGRFVLRGGGEYPYPLGIEWAVPDSLSGYSIRAEINVMARRGTCRNGYRLAALIKNKGETRCDAVLPLEHYLTAANQWQPVRAVFALPQPAEKGDQVAVFFFMPAREELELDNLTLTLQVIRPAEPPGLPRK